MDLPGRDGGPDAVPHGALAGGAGLPAPAPADAAADATPGPAVVRAVLDLPGLRFTPPSEADWEAAAARLLAALPQGGRVGESAVVSTCVHVLHVLDPDTVTVLADRDAGRVFYGRERPGEVVHLDVFHAPGLLPPARVASAFGSALRAYRWHRPGRGERITPDLFDTQTGVGGGRLGGELRGGQRPAARAAHRGHVHLAGRLPPGDAAFLFVLVAALERVLEDAGLPVRRPRRVLWCEAGPAGIPGGLEEYAALTDTWLRGPGRGANGPSAPAAHATRPRAPRSPGVPDATGSPRQGGGDGQGPGPAPRAASPGGVAKSVPNSVSTDVSNEVPNEDAILAAAARLADDLGGPDAARVLLQALRRSHPLSGLPAAGGTPALRSAAARLVQEGWAEAAGGGWRLTLRGLALYAAFTTRLREVELALRSAARGLAARRAHGRPGPVPVVPPGSRRRTCSAAPPARGERLVELAVAETVAAAAARSLARPAPGAPPAGPGPSLRGCPAARGEPWPRTVRVTAADLRVRRRLRPRRVDLCLLLDASASMEGGRMRAARTLARHLLLTGRGRVAVMAFQERGCTLAVPLTRNYAAAERGLRRIVPGGLTPLAAGLAGARQYLRRARASRALLLLVTDGIPTAGTGEGSPLEEALREAERLRAARVSVSCIGLEPNEAYLAELVRRAGGRLHVVPELRPEWMAQVARAERARLEAAGRRRVRGPAP